MIKIKGEIVSKNKNKRMDFEVNGGLRLYFDLLNYSEFVETASEVLVDENIVEKEEVILEEKKDNGKIIEGVNEIEEKNETIGITGGVIKLFSSITGKNIQNFLSRA